MTLFIMIIFFLKLNRIKTDETIRFKSLSELKQKKFFSIFNNNTEVTTDFSWDQIRTDTVYWRCSIDENRKLKFIQFINFKTGDGYGGMNINVIKIFNRFTVFVEPYTDNPINKINKENYSINYQNLILDKKNYKTGDSIFGRIDLEIEENHARKKIMHNGGGYFKIKLN